ncbi:hypothetical protein NK6_8877 [Bradyrhizobium diazoefficiens]|uniref:Uncharacterized protein n=1 Tax=Bradyrhizobium diazoefficiens TaxID=1355477 RepID=A0A0E4BVI8_9BRAD|nr:hypothetical protein NK6_8877 [Bradyrhizobium diazoefficiens]
MLAAGGRAFAPAVYPQTSLVVVENLQGTDP